MLRQITSPESLPRAEERKFRKGLPHQKEDRRIVKIKDLKPKRIKDYLEYKFSRRRNLVFTSRYVLNLPPGED
ncbi:hypothetical protein GQ457_04G020410 [Hibiscus cannabinus]